MKRESTGPILTTIFVDYDNIYLSLKRRNEEAAKRFAKDSAIWLRELESGRLIVPTNGAEAAGQRRIVMNRCYGNPVPRRNSSDNSTDMNSFPFVRHHFLRAGFEVIDCPPLTAQLKNSADIRMVMDVRDILNHDTRFDEFIILSGDADFTPLLHRLRAHARRTVVFANDHTAAPYTAITHGEVRETDLITLLVEGRLPGEVGADADTFSRGTAAIDIESYRREIIAEVVGAVRSSGQPVALEVLADRAVRALGHEKTAGTGWGGVGSFRELLALMLPEGFRVTDHAPYYVFDEGRTLASPPATQRRIEAPVRAPRDDYAAPEAPAPRVERSAPVHAPQSAPQRQPVYERAPQTATAAPASSPLPPAPRAPVRAPLDTPVPTQQFARPVPQQPQPAPQPQSRGNDQAMQIQQSIARIHEACQAPPLSPPEYRVLFDVMAQEITANGLAGTQTLLNIVQRAQELGVDVRREDVRFVLDVVSETDPWFEQGASANLFSSRFRNFVVARCRGQGLSLSVDELDLIEAWFASGPAPGSARGSAPAAAPATRPRPQQSEPRYAPEPQQSYSRTPSQQTAPAPEPQRERWWSLEEGRQHIAEQRAADRQAAENHEHDDEFPRIIRSRLRG